MRNLVTAMAIGGLLAWPAAADGPAALILDVSGTVEPAVQAFQEVGDGTVLELGPDATLTISHYGSCEEVAVSGGTVAVRADGLGLEGGEVLSRAEIACPGRVVMTEADLINMSVTLRAVTVPKTMAAAPEFFLAGDWGEALETLSVYDTAGRVATMPVAGGRAAWPADQAPLALGKTYVVVLNGPGAGQQAARIEVSDASQGVTVLTGK